LATKKKKAATRGKLKIYKIVHKEKLARSLYCIG